MMAMPSRSCLGRLHTSLSRPIDRPPRRRGMAGVVHGWRCGTAVWQASRRETLPEHRTGHAAQAARGACRGDGWRRQSAVGAAAQHNTGRAHCNELGRPRGYGHRNGRCEVTSRAPRFSRCCWSRPAWPGAAPPHFAGKRRLLQRQQSPSRARTSWRGGGRMGDFFEHMHLR